MMQEFIAYLKKKMPPEQVYPFEYWVKQFLKSLEEGEPAK